MTKLLFTGAFIIGAVAIIWIGQLFLGADLLGLAVTALIGGVYTIGVLELLRFRQATDTLVQALKGLTSPIDELSAWLAKMDPSLQNSARLRIEGERNALPAPVLTPYLVGLLVMLGLLGTFIGMVGTLKGAVVALEGNNELEAIRAGLAAPIEGLGLAFGTSVAGVAASAMLGLLSTLSRRERLQASQLLDTKAAQEMRHFSALHQQQLAFKAMQDQAKLLPSITDEFKNLANGLVQMGDQLGERLQKNQAHFHDKVTNLYGELNTSVEQSLKTTLVESAELIGSSIQPMTDKTLSSLNDIASRTQEQFAQQGKKQITAMQQAAQSNSGLVRETLDAVLAQQTDTTNTLVKSVNSALERTSSDAQVASKAMLDRFAKTSDQWANQQQDQATQFSQTIREQLQHLREDENKRGNDATERLGELQSVVSSHLQTLGSALEEPMTRLIETASQTPKAAAEVIENLRGEMSKNFERDNELLGERTRLMEQFATLSKTIESNSETHNKAIQELVENSSETLTTLGTQFGEQVETESNKLAQVASHFADSSIEMSSLSDAFNAAVTLFSESNNSLIENLTRIEVSLETANNRSDEQLAYYVAQAREIIDHNLLSHQQIISALHAQKPQQLAVQEVNS